MFASSDIIMSTEAWSNYCYDYHVYGFNYYILHRTIKEGLDGVYWLLINDLIFC